ncbi:sporulation inhibitor of replication protein SirA [Caldibacillus lycopersici]|uniref:Sporulation inhibitor of replication protein SirA n=1 Tax=Perspicuibacillus lycopersici TaxID=1325689 RepID=A0AAE3IRA3_9BACI|nr:sporulation inhibitor of replication protein SirA [Perspicuibacillus lycopersici]MCU9611961.1 sporulation inhibitor of replication protein SirA [Perspicuibacillus lycopersici]
MRQCEMYIIDDLFANYYYGRERMFFNLFKECVESRAQQQEILLKQINYITKPIPTLRIHTHIMQHLQTRNDFFIKKGVYSIENKRGTARLKINERHLTIESTGSIDSEMYFMEVLRSTEYNILALDLKNERYGWVKPLRERKFV